MDSCCSNYSCPQEINVTPQRWKSSLSVSRHQEGKKRKWPGTAALYKAMCSKQLTHVEGKVQELGMCQKPFLSSVDMKRDKMINSLMVFTIISTIRLIPVCWREVLKKAGTASAVIFPDTHPQGDMVSFPVNIHSQVNEQYE